MPSFCFLLLCRQQRYEYLFNCEIDRCFVQYQCVSVDNVWLLYFICWFLARVWVESSIYLFHSFYARRFFAVIWLLFYLVCFGFSYSVHLCDRQAFDWFQIYWYWFLQWARLYTPPILINSPLKYEFENLAYMFERWWYYALKVQWRKVSRALIKLHVVARLGELENLCCDLIW